MSPAYYVYFRRKQILQDWLQGCQTLPTSPAPPPAANQLAGARTYQEKEGSSGHVASYAQEVTSSYQQLLSGALVFGHKLYARSCFTIETLPSYQNVTITSQCDDVISCVSEMVRAFLLFLVSSPLQSPGGTSQHELTNWRGNWLIAVKISSCHFLSRRSYSPPLATQANCKTQARNPISLQPARQLIHLIVTNILAGKKGLTIIFPWSSCKLRVLDEAELWR